MKESQTDSEKPMVTPNKNSNLVLQELVNECITDVIWEMDLTRQKFTYVSPAVYRLRGITVEEAMQEEFHQSLHEDDYHYITNHLPPRISHFENGDESLRILTGEFRQPRKDGSFADVEITTVLLKNFKGKVDRIAGVTREIAHRKAQKELLSNTQSLFETVFNFTATGIALLNDDGIFINANNGFCKMLGYPMNYVVGKSFDHFLVNGDEPFIKGLFKDTKCKKSLEQQSEIRMVNLHGQVIWGLINITGVPSNNQNSIQWVVQIQETTQRKRAEEIIKLLNADLKLKNREMEQLIYITSHDLRSPLVNIKGFNNELQYSLKQYKDLHNDFGSALLTEKASLIEKDINESIEYINLSIDKMDRLLKGLLGYSRLGRKIRVPALIFMNNLVADVIKTNEYQLKNSHIVIDISDLPSCWASEQMINQAFSNLLSNAINYRDDNKKGFIKISGEKRDNLVTYCIEDNGIGIEPQHHEKVFELFYRLNPQKGEGEGLGLPTVKKIIELNAGKIRLESEPGKGSKFFVTLPAESSVQNPELTD